MRRRSRIQVRLKSPATRGDVAEFTIQREDALHISRQTHFGCLRTCQYRSKLILSGRYEYAAHQLVYREVNMNFGIMNLFSVQKGGIGTDEWIAHEVQKGALGQTRGLGGNGDAVVVKR